MEGKFIISLDFELFWGVFDKRTVENYQSHLNKVSYIIDNLLDLSEQYNVKLTFATVGFLFAEDKTELLEYTPKVKPTYELEKFNPYNHFKNIGNNEKEDPYHYALSMIKKIDKNGTHEIGTHTFSHYYCHEKGQTVSQFNEDLKAAAKIAEKENISLSSIVFPRNMIESHDYDYLKACTNNNIITYRGKEKAFFYNIHTTKPYHGWYIFRGLRMLDSYVNISGYNTYKPKINKEVNIVNLPSSRLLRAYSNKFKKLESLKIKRIKSAMTHAAKKSEVFHLWWHPHNFGANTDENFNNLEAIFKHYKSLNTKHNFSSETMTNVAKLTLSAKQ